MVNKTYYKKIKKDYQRKNLSNPFFRRRQKGKRAALLKWLIILGVLALLVLIWFFLFSSFWRLETVQINGLTRTDNSAIAKIIYDQAGTGRLLIFKQNNIFLFNKAAAAQKIMADYNLAGSAIRKKLPRTLEIELSERPYAFIFQEGSTLFYASADGYIIKESAVRTEDQNQYFILENKNTGSLIDAGNKIAVKSDYLNYILDLENRLAAYSKELPVDRFIIDQEFKMVTVKFTDGPAVYFNTLTGAADQISRLLLVKKEKIKDNFRRTNYIDLRYGDLIYINPDFNN